MKLINKQILRFLSNYIYIYKKRIFIIYLIIIYFIIIDLIIKKKQATNSDVTIYPV